MPHDEFGNILARDQKIVLPEGSSIADGRYEDYVFEVTGIVHQSREELEMLPNYVALGIEEPRPFIPGDKPFGVAAYRVRAFHMRSPVVGVASWHPGENTISKRYEGIPLLGPDESHIARRGLELFYAIQHHRPGTPDEEAFEEAIQLCLEWLHDNPGSTPTEFGRPQLTAKRVTGPDATKKWLREKHFGIREVQQEAARRLGKSG